MLPDYQDIRSLTDRDPKWFDDNGVPRYWPFHPSMLGVYDRSAVLAEIACQQCGQRFFVGEGSPPYDQWTGAQPKSLESIVDGYHFGDPPRHACVGDTMNCDDLRIVEAWKRAGAGSVWERVPELEGPIDDDSMDCPSCDGTGAQRPSIDPCWRCNGEGVIASSREPREAEEIPDV